MHKNESPDESNTGSTAESNEEPYHGTAAAVSANQSAQERRGERLPGRTTPSKLPASAEHGVRPQRPLPHGALRTPAPRPEVAVEALGARTLEILSRIYIQLESAEEICAAMNLTQTQFRLLRASARREFQELFPESDEASDQPALNPCAVA